MKFIQCPYDSCAFFPLNSPQQDLLEGKKNNPDHFFGGIEIFHLVGFQTTDLKKNADQKGDHQFCQCYHEWFAFMLRMAKVMDDDLPPNGFMTNGHMDHLNGNDTWISFKKAMEKLR